MTERRWPDEYPDLAALRAELRAMADAWVEVLKRRLPKGSVRGIYLKGSGLKAWDSAIDYVPELSDVDVHLLLHGGEARSAFDDLENALEVRREVTAAFRERVPAALHQPRPQLMLLNDLETDPEYVPSPRATTVTLVGEPYPDYSYSDEERAQQRTRDAANLRSHAEFVAALPLRALDKPGDYLLTLLYQLSWRVSPIGSRVLSIHGDTIEDAWSPNRTAIARRLEAIGHAELAACYRRYYLEGWEYFLSQRRDAEALGRSLAAGVEAVERGAAIAAEG